MVKRRAGFTLIEIVLVLAMAGFILVIVFLGLVGAQRARRDAQRKTDLGLIYSAIESYGSNNAGTYPTTAQFATFWASAYITGLNIHDPSTQAAYALGSGWPTPAATGTVYYRRGVACDGSVTAAGYSVKMGLENSELCRDLR